LIELHRDVIDNVPVHWADSSGPSLAALIFRVGLADETLASTGITHLVEHLALSAVKRGSLEMNGFVDATRTVFLAKGRPEEIAEFVNELCLRLSEPRTERIEHESRVLATEAQTFNAGILGILLRLRFGPRRHGLGSYPQLGLASVDATALRAWGEDRFTAGNVTAWMTKPPAGSLRFPLRPGRRVKPVEPQPLDVEYPAAAPTEASGAGVSFLVRRTVAFTGALSVAVKRSQELLRYEHGLSYAHLGHYDRFTADLAHAAIVSDAAPDRAREVARRLLDLVEQMGKNGATETELSEGIDAIERSMSDGEGTPSFLDSNATDELCGASILSPHSYLTELRALTPAATAAAMRDALTTAILVGADDKELNTRLHPYPLWSETPIRGRSYRAKGQSWFQQRPRVVAGDEGVSFVGADGKVSTIRFSDCVAMLCGELGTRLLFGADASVINFSADLFDGGDRLLRLVDSRIPPERCAPIVPGRRPLAAPPLARLPAHAFR
jgi:zinc protease